MTIIVFPLVLKTFKKETQKSMTKMYYIMYIFVISDDFYKFENILDI